MSSPRDSSAKRSHNRDYDRALNQTCVTAKSPRRPAHIPSSSNTPYTVFISHAGEDKATIAIPLREMLNKHGIAAFVDETDIARGADAQRAMIDAMETAKVAVIVLSPEFIARKWPIKELMCFLRRVDESDTDDSNAPVIIPFFYRLTIKDIYSEPRLDRRDKDGNRLYEQSRFFERMKKGEPEADISTIQSSLRKLHGLMGVRNDFEASNDSAHIAYRRREVLLRELCDYIRDAVKLRLTTALNVNTRMAPDDLFHAYFDAQDTSDLVFDFHYDDEEPSTCSQEARLLKLLLDESQSENTSIAVRGIGGVGKTSLMRGILSLDSVKQRFRDGVYHFSIGVDGTKRDLIEELSKAVEVSGGSEEANVMRNEKKIEHVMKSFRSWFEQRKCLFIADDVWQTRELSTSVICELLRLPVSGDASKLLLTTRSADIASSASSLFCLEPRGSIGSESERILMRYAGIKPEKNEDHKAVNDILERCVGLPLFLAVSGKAIKTLSSRRGHEGCAAYHMYARKLKENIHPMFTTGTASHARLDNSLMISLGLLEERKQDFGFQASLSIMKMYRRLFILKRQSKVPVRMLKFLWELETDGQAAYIAGELENVGLADLEFEKRDCGYVELLGIHDSLHEFASMETRKHNEDRVVHDALLNGYERGLATKGGCHEWWHICVEADGYIHANLCRHLLAAGRIAELIVLMMSPEWAVRQVKVNSILFFDADLLLTVKATQELVSESSDEEGSETLEGSETRRALELLAEAVALSFRFVGSNVTELCFQLYGRLKGFRESCRPIEKYVAWIETDAERPKILCDNSSLAEPGELNTRRILMDVSLRCIAVMRGGENVACGCADGRIFVMDVRRGVVAKRWEAHDSALSAIAVSKDGTRIVSGSRDKTAKVWNVNTGGCMAIFRGHGDTVSGVAVLGDGRRVISVSFFGSAFLWDIETGQVLSTVCTGLESINCVAMLGDGEVAVMGGEGGKLRMWNLAANEQVGDSFGVHAGIGTCVAVTLDEKRIISGSWDCTVRVWDIGSQQQIASISVGQFVLCVAVSEDGRRIISGLYDGTIRVWDLKSGTQICDPLEAGMDHVVGVSFLADPDRILSSSSNGTVRVWNLTRENKRRVPNPYNCGVSGVSFTPDGKFVLSASNGRALRIWDTASGQQVADPLCDDSEHIADVVVTPNGQFILSVSWDRTLSVWDFQSRRVLRKFTGHSEDILCVAVTPQGDRAVTGSGDKTVRVWNLAAMDDSPCVFEGHSAWVTRVFVSDDGLRIVSVDYDDNIFVWELATKKLHKRFKKENPWKLSRREVLNIIGETTVHDDTALSIPLFGRQIRYGEGPDARILATMEADILSWALSPSKKMICLGLKDDQVAFMRIVS